MKAENIDLLKYFLKNLGSFQTKSELNIVFEHFIINFMFNADVDCPLKEHKKKYCKFFHQGYINT